MKLDPQVCSLSSSQYEASNFSSEGFTYHKPRLLGRVMKYVFTGITVASQLNVVESVFEMDPCDILHVAGRKSEYSLHT